MGALDLLHIEPHEFAALHLRSDGRAQLTRTLCRVAKSLQLAHVRFKREHRLAVLLSLNWPSLSAILGCRVNLEASTSMAPRLMFLHILDGNGAGSCVRWHDHEVVEVVAGG